MFGVDSIELIIVAIAALLFIGPKELPSAMRAVGRWVGKIRGMARHFTAGIDAVIRGRRTIHESPTRATRLDVGPLVSRRAAGLRLAVSF